MSFLIFLSLLVVLPSVLGFIIIYIVENNFYLLWHKLLKYDYVCYCNEIYRIRKTPKLQAYIIYDGRFKQITKHDEVIWLTCDSSKYGIYKHI